MRFSLSLRPGSADPVSAKEIAEFSQLAEKLGYYAVYITDHYYITTPNLHSVGAAAVVAASTETVKIGFAAYQAPLRHPIAAAKELASLDILCNGRFICGLAAGSYEPEFKAFGIPFNRRGAMLEESVQRIVEKPAPQDAPSTLGVVGRYLLTPRIFFHLRRVKPGSGGEIQLTDGIASLLREEKVLAHEFEGVRFDCGNKLGYLKANIELALRHPELGAEFRRYLRGRMSR